jgi:hypothetical protein
MHYLTNKSNRFSTGDRLPPDVGTVRRDPNHQPHAPRDGQRVYRLVGRVHQHGLPRLPLPRSLRSHLRLQAGQAGLHLRTRAIRLLNSDRMYSQSCGIYHLLYSQLFLLHSWCGVLHRFD